MRPQFYKPQPPPIDWTTVKMPDPNDEEDQWAMALVVIVGLALIIVGLAQIGPYP